jgi:hypothetical protein
MAQNREVGMDAMKVNIDEKVISRDVERGGKFLRTLGVKPRIRAALSRRGYDDAEHQRLWNLLLILMGYKPSAAPAQVAVENLSSLTFLDNSDEPLLDALRVVLEIRYPDQYAYITSGLTAQKGPGSVVVIQHIVDRYAALRDGSDPSRAGTRELDKKVADLLASRAVLSPAIEVDFRAQLAKATAIAPEVPSEPSTDAQRKYDEAAVEFHVSIHE